MTTRVRRALGPAASLLTALSLTLSCGVPMQDRATQLPAEQAPFGLGERTTSTSATGATAAVVYLVADDRLVPARRTFPATPTITELAEALTAPLSAEETANGLRRALADRELLANVMHTGDLATVELTDAFSLLPSREQLLALGQVVLTLTQLDMVSRVRFTLDDEPLAVPTAGGSVSNEPLLASDYERLLT